MGRRSSRVNRIRNHTCFFGIFHTLVLPRVRDNPERYAASTARSKPARSLDTAAG